MVKIEKEIEKDWYLIHLEGTRYYQVWNKWELFEILLERGATLWDEDFPMHEADFDAYFQKVKEVKEYEKDLNNNTVKPINAGSDDYIIEPNKK